MSNPGLELRDRVSAAIVTKAVPHARQLFETESGKLGVWSQWWDKSEAAHASASEIGGPSGRFTTVEIVRKLAGWRMIGIQETEEGFLPLLWRSQDLKTVMAGKASDPSVFFFDGTVRYTPPYFLRFDGGMLFLDRNGGSVRTLGDVSGVDPVALDPLSGKLAVLRGRAFFYQGETALRVVPVVEGKEGLVHVGSASGKTSLGLPHYSSAGFSDPWFYFLADPKQFPSAEVDATPCYGVSATDPVPQTDSRNEWALARIDTRTGRAVPVARFGALYPMARNAVPSSEGEIAVCRRSGHVVVLLEERLYWFPLPGRQADRAMPNHA